jgi:glycosyltransferase involved in cell wall biosynthesis
MNTPMPFLSVVLPSYNEKKNLKRGALDEAYQFLKDFERSWELILSDDGSTDGTLETLEAFAKKDARISVLANQHRGKGPTVKSGMLAAQGKWRLFADFDQSTPMRDVRELLKYVPDYDVVLGSREASGAKREKEPFYRHLMGRGFNLLVQILAVPGIADTQCGFKLFSAEATEKLFPKLWVYSGKSSRQTAFTGAFDVELLYLAKKYHFRMKEVPIKWQHFHTDRVNPIRDSVLMFIDILRIRLASLTGKYPKS